MQIEFDIDEELLGWAAWARRDKTHGHYPSVSAGFEEYMAGYRTSSPRISITDDRGSVIDACVGQMAITHPDWAEVLWCKYIMNHSEGQLKRRLKIGRNGVRERIKCAQGCVTGLLLSQPFVEKMEEVIGLR